MKGVCVIGLGYVGLTLAVTLAKTKILVYGIDCEKEKVEKLSSGIPTLYEPGMDKLLKRVIQNGSFKVHNSLNGKIKNEVDTYIVSVGTPLDDNTKKPMLNHIEDSIREIAKFLKKGDLVVMRSTLPVGTTRNVIKKLIEENTGFVLGQDFYLSFAPERTVEGNALEELNELPQIVGAIDIESADKTANIFNKITKTVIRMSSFESSEVVKLIDNASRDVNLAMANIFGLVFEKLGLKSKEIIEAANYGYSRNRIFRAGAGVGGPCLVKDPYFLIDSVKSEMDLPLISLARKINESMPNHVIDLIEQEYQKINKPLENSKVLILGFAFKGTPPTDDIRFSPTIPVLEYLKNKKANIYGYDPQVNEEVIKDLGVNPINPNEVSGIECILIMNNNKIYLDINYDLLIKNSNTPIILIDGWQLLDDDLIKELGFEYRCVGNGQKLK